jgi:hypothetical protein
MESPYPKLAPDLVIDDQALAAAVDEMLRRDAEYRRQTAEILSSQAKLRSQVTDNAWQLYLRLDEAHTTRLADATAAVARWAFGQGQQCGGLHQAST